MTLLAHPWHLHAIGGLRELRSFSPFLPPHTPTHTTHKSRESRFPVPCTSIFFLPALSVACVAVAAILVRVGACADRASRSGLERQACVNRASGGPHRNWSGAIHPFLHLRLTRRVLMFTPHSI